MKAVVAAFNQEKALVGAFSVIVQSVVEPMDRFAALVLRLGIETARCEICLDPRSAAAAGGGSRKNILRNKTS